MSWPWPLPLYFEIENHFILLHKSVPDGDSQHLGIQTYIFNTWPCDLCVNIYTKCIYIYKCMYVCTCVCIHAHLCHVYIVCHEYIDTYMYLFLVHLDIILLVVSDKFSTAAMQCPTFLWPLEGKIEFSVFGGKKIVTSKRRCCDQSSPGGSLL